MLNPKIKEMEVVWPSGWRLPTAGEHVIVEPGFGGFVEYVDWDLAEGVMRVYLR